MVGRVLQLCVMVMVVVVVVVAGAATTGTGGAEIVFKPCKTTTGIPKCKVKTVLVDGCQKEKTHDMNHIPSVERERGGWRKGLRMSTCNINQRTKLNFTITVHSGFTTDRLSSQFSLVSPRLDCTPEGGASHCIFREYVRNGCRGTVCPLGVDQPQDVTDSLKINPDSNTSKRPYTAQWKLWNKSNEKENCCFVFKLWYN